MNHSASKIILANMIGNSDQKALQIVNKRHQYQLEWMHFLQVGVWEHFPVVSASLCGWAGRWALCWCCSLPSAGGGKRRRMSLGLVFSFCFLFSLPYTWHQILKLLHSSLTREEFAFFSALGFSKWPCGILLFSSSLKSSLVVDECRKFVIN